MADGPIRVTAYTCRLSGEVRYRIARCQFSPRGKTLATLSRDEALHLCDELTMLVERDAPDVLLSRRGTPPGLDPDDERRNP